MQAALAQWNPKENNKATEDAYKTLFVAKISYDTTEKKVWLAEFVGKSMNAHVVFFGSTGELACNLCAVLLGQLKRVLKPCVRCPTGFKTLHKTSVFECVYATRDITFMAPMVQ